MERDRSESENGFTGFVHSDDILLKPLRGSGRAQLALIRHNNRRSEAALRSYTIDVADPCRVIHVLPYCTNAVNIGRCTDVLCSEEADADIVVASRVVLKRLNTNRGVAETRRVDASGPSSDGRVFACICTGVGRERAGAYGRVVISGGVGGERTITHRGVVGASVVGNDCEVTDSRVTGAGGVGKKRCVTNRGIVRRNVMK